MRAKARAATLEGQLWAMAPRMGFSALLMAGFAYLLQDRLAAFDPAAALAQVQGLHFGQWLGAILATGISFWAVGRYDGALHQHLATGVPLAQARRAGITAIAISQTVGAGVVSGALIRWRMLPGVSLWQATRLSFAVSLSFLAGWAVVTGAVLVIFAQGGLWFTGLGALAFGAVCFALGSVQPHMLRRMQLPNGLIQARLVGLTLIDTLAACFALYLFIPESAGLAFTALLPAFLLALGAGLASGTPGGVGAFELALLGLLPLAPDDALLAAVLGWRMVYFAVPAVLAAAVALIGPRKGPVDAGMRTLRNHEHDAMIAQSPRAETALVRQGHLAMLQDRLGRTWTIGRTGHCLVTMFDPVGDITLGPSLTGFAKQARQEGRVPALYKCASRTALQARHSGWHVMALAPEAVLNPATFSLHGPHLAALRRKLRKAASAGVSLHIAHAIGAAERAAIARLWARARKGERGFSMGRYDEAYLARQLVIEARVADKLMAFASFHVGAQEWTLDLMRHHPDSPDGTMQAIVVHALGMAQADGIGRLSLASAGPPPPIRPFKTRDTGLVQFKQMFAPRWLPQYIAAPSRAQLLLAGLEIARAIHRPAPLRKHRPAQDHLAQNEFAHGAQAWHTGA
ncbi:MAG: phosphatidylglycerol lysyltransferase domain-containing protein [Paracoccaceae bacterium]